MNHLLELKDISKYYHSNDVVTLGLRKINTTFDKGEFVAVVGESGSGKSTLMNVVSGIDTYEEGELYYQGEETSCYTADEWDKYRKENVSFVFQDYKLIDSYSVLQNVELALYDMYPIKADRRSRAMSLIEQVGLTSHIKHRCTKLSGGEKQRVAIARALAKNAPILIADEPTGNLDEVTAKAIIKLLAEVSKDKLLIMVTHNFDNVDEVATRKIRLYDGSIAEDRVIREKNKNQIADRIILDKDSIEDKKKIRLLRLQNLFNISINNIISTPKKSILLLTTAFISSILFLLYVLVASGVIMRPPDVNYYYDRKDTAIVFTSDRAEFNTDTADALLGIKGVEAVMVHYSAHTNGIQSLIPTTSQYHSTYFSIQNIASFNKKYLEYGTMPTKDNEVLLTFGGIEKPNLNLIGKEVSFQKRVHNNNSGYSNTTSIIEKKYIVTGFTMGKAMSNSSCYLSSKAIEELSVETNEIMINNNMYRLSLNNSTVSITSNVKTSDMIIDSSVPLGEAILIFNDTAEYSENDPLYPYYKYFNEESREDEILYLYNNNNSFHLNINISTNTHNSEIYNEFYTDNIALAVNPKDISLPLLSIDESNSATIIFDENYKIEQTILRLQQNGYKVAYKYQRPLGANGFENRFQELLTAVILGIIMLGLGVLFITEIFTRIMKSKKKDYNIFRTLGLSSTSIKTLTFIEYLLLTLSAFLI